MTPERPSPGLRRPPRASPVLSGVPPNLGPVRNPMKNDYVWALAAILGILAMGLLVAVTWPPS